MDTTLAKTVLRLLDAGFLINKVLEGARNLLAARRWSDKAGKVLQITIPLPLVAGTSSLLVQKVEDMYKSIEEQVLREEQENAKDGSTTTKED